MYIKHNNISLGGSIQRQTENIQNVNRMNISKNEQCIFNDKLMGNYTWVCETQMPPGVNSIKIIMATSFKSL